MRDVIGYIVVGLQSVECGSVTLLSLVLSIRVMLDILVVVETTA
jgi:hypothetical protein